MRVRKAAFLSLVVLCASACSEAAPGITETPQFAFNQDLVGTPDLVVDRLRLAASWVIYEESFSANSCAAIEGDIPPGAHRTLRFTVMVPNVGDADVFIGNPRRHMDPNGDGNFSDSDGLYEFAECHGHFHFRNYATYELIPVNANGSLGNPIQARKRGFCMIDTDPYRNDNTPPESFVYRSCGSRTRDGFQGISTGWADTYNKWLSGQLFLLTDPNEPVPPGDYVIRITANPPFTAALGEPCPALDGNLKCRMFTESNYNNNIAEVRVNIPAARPGRTGYGPGGGQEPPARELIDGENRPRG